MKGYWISQRQPEDVLKAKRVVRYVSAGMLVVYAIGWGIQSCETWWLGQTVEHHFWVALIIEFFQNVVKISQNICLSIFTACLIYIATQMHSAWKVYEQMHEVAGFFRLPAEFIKGDQQSLQRVAIVLPTLQRVPDETAEQKGNARPSPWTANSVENLKRGWVRDEATMPFPDLLAAADLISLFSHVSLPTPRILSDNEVLKELKEGKCSLQAMIVLGWFSNEVTFHLLNKFIGEGKMIQSVDNSRRCGGIIRVDNNNSCKWTPGEKSEIGLVALLNERSDNGSSSQSIAVTIGAGASADGTRKMGNFFCDKQRRIELELRMREKGENLNDAQFEGAVAIYTLKPSLPTAEAFDLIHCLPIKNSSTEKGTEKGPGGNAEGVG